MSGFDLGRRRLLFATLSSVVCPAFGALAQTRGVGIVRTISGSAEAATDSVVRQLAQDANIFVGDRITTGSGARASFALGEATELRLGSNARIRIDRFLANAGGVINLEAGAVAFDRDAARESGPMTIRSAYGLIGVRGTRFFAGPSNGVFGVFVDRGAVSVTGGNKQVVVRAGEGTDIAAPGDQPTPPKPWGARRIQLALGQFY